MDHFSLVAYPQENESFSCMGTNLKKHPCVEGRVELTEGTNICISLILNTHH